MYNIKDFGALGDGQNSTAALQAAADKCREDGGGIIIIPAGEYVISSVRLYSNTTLELADGAKLLLDNNEENYGIQRGKYETIVERDIKTVIGIEDAENQGYLIRMFLEVLRLRTDTMFFAENEENITIKGGTLDGRFPLFYDTDIGQPVNPDIPRWKRSQPRFKAKRAFRPHMLVFRKCKNILLENIDILNGPFFNIRILECDMVRCEKLNIETDRRCVNTDGINIGASRNCIIHGCHFVTGDDSIAISVGENLVQNGNCENITVTDCCGESSTNFVRVFSGIDVDLGYVKGIRGEDAVNVARNQKVSNVMISDCDVSDGGVNVISTYGSVENVTFKNLKTSQSGGSPVVFMAIQKDGKIENISFENLDCKTKGIATILGTDRESVKNIKFSGCNFYVEPSTRLFGNGIIDPLIHYWIQAMAPYNLYIRHASDICIENSQVEWGNADFSELMQLADVNMIPECYRPLWRDDMNPRDSFPCVSAFDVRELLIDNFKCSGFNGCDWIESEKTDNLVIKNN